MSANYKIEGENDFAYFRASSAKLRQIFESDRRWAKNFVEMEGDIYGKVIKFDLVSSAAGGVNIIEQSDTHFVIRGGQYFFYRVKAVDANTSRILPEGRLWGYWKYIIPIVLLIWCVIPVVLTPLIYKLRQKQALQMSKHYLKPLCTYLEARGNQLFGLGTQGVI